MGSFLNCLIWRIHQGESTWDRSYCPKCKGKIAWYDNIPVLSFLLLRGRCRKCRKAISVQYPLVELAMGILFVLAFFHKVSEPFYFDLSYPLESLPLLSLVRDWLIIFVCLAILVYDWRWYIIPDIIILPAVVIISIVNIAIGGEFLDILWPALIGGTFFAIQFFVSRGKWIGGGDVRFGVFMGVALADLNLLIVALLLAYWSGALAGVALMAYKKKKWTSRMPLGIFLSLGTVLALFLGKSMIDWYFGLL